MVLSSFGRLASRLLRSGAKSSTTSAVATSPRALLAPTVFSSAAEAPITTSRRSPFTCKRSATGLWTLASALCGFSRFRLDRRRRLRRQCFLRWLALRPVLRPGPIVVDGGADETFQRRRIDLVALEKVNRASLIAFKACVEEFFGVRQPRPMLKGQLHFVLVGVADRDDAVTRPHRTAHPFPFL